ncbi:hypothetical protein HPB50_011998 [Hyalomma asiaticum]|uniref:Uncharacterized protein n=1 Tax=Hyalomma asiaticum TaxID=266040 RepID=A0ACB7T426_HYAAI|nr:hypothetical protein HPB50_011998 [Hyalomma asiaticum]
MADPKKETKTSDSIRHENHGSHLGHFSVNERDLFYKWCRNPGRSARQGHPIEDNVYEASGRHCRKPAGEENAATFTRATATEECYDDAIDVLDSRFGNKRLVVQEHLRRLRELPAVTRSSDFQGIRKFTTSSGAKYVD